MNKTKRVTVTLVGSKKQILQAEILLRMFQGFIKTGLEPAIAMKFVADIVLVSHNR